MYQKNNTNELQGFSNSITAKLQVLRSHEDIIYVSHSWRKIAIIISLFPYRMSLNILEATLS